MRGPIELLKASWDIFINHWTLFLGVFLVPGVISAIFDFISYKQTVIRDENGIASSVPTFMLENPAGFWALFGVVIVSLIFMSVALSKAVVELNTTTVRSAYDFARRYAIPYAGLLLLIGVLVLLGGILLIIPGVIISVWLSFSYFVLLFEKKGIIDSMKASREYVRGQWWAVFGRFLALGLAVIVLSIGTGLVGMVLSFFYIPEAASAALVSFVTSAIAMPVVIAYYYFMYQDLRKLKGSSPIVAGTPVSNEAAV